MSQTPTEPTRTLADPADSMLLSLARAIAGGAATSGATWPRLDLADPKQRSSATTSCSRNRPGGLGVSYAPQSSRRDVAIRSSPMVAIQPRSRFLAEAGAAARLCTEYRAGARSGLA